MIVNIYKNIFLGDIHSLKEDHDQYDIKYVFSLLDNQENIMHDNHYFFEFEDNLMFSKELLLSFLEIYTIIQNTKQNILIHCYEGLSRSVSIIYLLLMTLYNLDYNTCYKLVKFKRPNININTGFEKVLREFSKYVFTKPPEIIDLQLILIEIINKNNLNNWDNIK